MAVNDAFIACWVDKFHFNRIRPLTYIRRVIDKNWDTLLITPPFPEYPFRPFHPIGCGGIGADGGVRRGSALTMPPTPMMASNPAFRRFQRRR